MSDREGAADFFDSLEGEFGHLRDDEAFRQECKGRPRGEVRLLEFMRGVVVFMPVIEQAVTEIVGLAVVTTDEAEKFEKAVMSDQEGREVVERLYRQKPYLFSGFIGSRGSLC